MWRLTSMMLLFLCGCARVSNGVPATGDAAALDGPRIDADLTSLDFASDSRPPLPSVSPSPFDSFQPALARIGNDVLIAWIQELASGERALYVRHLDATGVPTSAPIHVDGLTDSNPDTPQIFALGGAFKLLWHKSDRAHYAQLPPGGSPSNTRDEQLGGELHIASDSVGFGTFYRRNSDRLLYFRAFDSDFLPLAQPVLVDVPDADVSHPAIGYCDGNWVVAWSRLSGSSRSVWGIARLDAQGQLVVGPLDALTPRISGISFGCVGTRLLQMTKTTAVSREWQLQLALRDPTNLDVLIGPTTLWINRDESLTHSLDWAGGRLFVAFEAEHAAGPVFISAMSLIPEIGLGITDAGLGSPLDSGPSYPYADSGAPLGLQVTTLERGLQPAMVVWDDGRALIAFRTTGDDGFEHVVVRSHHFSL